LHAGTEWIIPSRRLGTIIRLPEVKNELCYKILRLSALPLPKTTKKMYGATGMNIEEGSCQYMKENTQ